VNPILSHVDLFHALHSLRVLRYALATSLKLSVCFFSLPFHIILLALISVTIFGVHKRTNYEVPHYTVLSSGIHNGKE
jgi:hypothetical protein